MGRPDRSSEIHQVQRSPWRWSRNPRTLQPLGPELLELLLLELGSMRPEPDQTLRMPEPELQQPVVERGRRPGRERERRLVLSWEPSWELRTHQSP